MAEYSLAEILRRLEDTGFRDISGTRISATVPVSERLVNEIISAKIPRSAPVSAVHVQPLAGDRFSVRLTPRAAFLPSLTLKLEVERQPDFPSSPALGLRLTTMGGLLGIAGAAFPIASMLPPGVRLDGDRILVDLAAVARQQGVASFLQHVTSLRVNTEDGHVVLHVKIEVQHP